MALLAAPETATAHATRIVVAASAAATSFLATPSSFLDAAAAATKRVERVQETAVFEITNSGHSYIESNLGFI